MQNLTIAGTVGKDAILRRTPGGDPVLNFSLAVDNGKDKDGNRRESTWFDCALWGKRGESLERHIVKGSKLALSGRPSARAHEGKAYLGINVQELTFMGGGERREGGDDGSSGSGKSLGDGASTYNDIDDEIPF
jgi:single-strand DNA-binding protein